MNLETKLVALFLALELASLAALGALGLNAADNQLRDATFKTLRSNSQLIEMQVMEHFQNQIKSLADLSENKHHFANESDITAVQLEINEEHASNPEHYELSYLDRSGRVLASSNRTQIGRDYSNDGTFKGAIAGTPQLSEPFKAENGKASYSISVPVHPRPGVAPSGVLQAKYTFETLNALTVTAANVIGQTGDVFLVGADKTAITKPKYLTDSDVLSRKIDTAGINGCLSNGSHFGAYDDYRGVPILGSFSKKLMAKELGKNWCIAVKIDAAEAFAPIEALKARALGLAALLAVVSAIAIVAISRSITQPVKRLAQIAKDLSLGKPGGETEGSERDDEIGELSRSFNRILVSMRLAMKQAAPELKKQADDLRRALREKDEAETELRETANRLQAVLGLVDDAIITIGPEGKITSWNAAAEKKFGYRENEALGKDLTFIMPERFRKRHKDGLRRTVETGESRTIGKTVEYTGLRKDGTEFPMELSLGKWQAKDGSHFAGLIHTHHTQAFGAKKKPLEKWEK